MNEKEINEFLEQFDTLIISAKKDDMYAISTKGTTVDIVINLAELIELISKGTGKPAKFWIGGVMEVLELKKATEVFNERSAR